MEKTVEVVSKRCVSEITVPIKHYGYAKNVHVHFCHELEFGNDIWFL